MNRDDKIRYARQYSEELASSHPEICGILLGGSVARGDDLPISDVDLRCFVDGSSHPLPIEQHFAHGMYIDVAQHPSNWLTRPELEEDVYDCGFLYDALILHDRDGIVARCQARARSALASPECRATQLRSIRESAVRNCHEFAASLEAKDPCEACRSAIFGAWDLSDFMLATRSVPPGGARGLARLVDAWPEAATALTDYEGSGELDPEQVERLLDAYRSVAHPSSFFDMWIQKVEWMFANGYTADAFHALWIALGLRVKDTRDGSDEDFSQRLRLACTQWLEIIRWDWTFMKGKLAELREMIDSFSPAEDHGTETANMGLT